MPETQRWFASGCEEREREREREQSAAAFLRQMHLSLVTNDTQSEAATFNAGIVVCGVIFMPKQMPRRQSYTSRSAPSHTSATLMLPRRDVTAV
jgi:hypothetical protein